MIATFWVLTAVAGWAGFLAALLTLYIIYTLATGRRLL